MIRSVILMLCGLLAIPMACSSNDGGQPAPADEPNPPQELNIPAWYVSPPKQPGQAFYGTGVATFDNPSFMSNAKSTAELRARQQIAETMRTTIEAAVKTYQRRIDTPEGDVAEEGLSQSVARSVTDITLSGVAIEKAEVKENPEGGYNYYVLAKIGFDAVADNLHSEMSEKVEQVRQNADEAFDELDRLLEDQQEQQADDAPAGGELPDMEKEGGSQ
jgi:hypothetical protein